MSIQIKRAYQSPSAADGIRFVVDRYWPRGVKREALALEGWLKEISPSPGLCKWFGHAPERWDEFRRRYFAELDENAAALAPLLEAARRGPLTLVYGARDEEHNNAAALREYLLARLGSGAVE